MNIEQMIKRIDDIAKQRGISRNKLLISCDSKYYADNLNKGKLPNLASIAKIADYLDVSIDYLAGRTDKPDVNR